MSRKNSVSIRVDGNLADILQNAQDVRVQKGLATTKEMNMPEITNLLLKTDGFQQSMNELKSKPKNRK